MAPGAETLWRYLPRRCNMTSGGLGLRSMWGGFRLLRQSMGFLASYMQSQGGAAHGRRDFVRPESKPGPQNR
eukprot:5420513-Prymnesium_polylepis.1